MALERTPPVRTREDRRRWETFAPERTVLAVARTFTSTVRLLQALTVFRQDSRIEVLFTFDGSSAFHAGVDTLLRESGVQLVPWADADGLGADLLLTASENVTAVGGRTPLVVLPHGIGFHKFVPDSRRPEHRLSGVVPAEHLRRRPVWIAVSHSSQREQLRTTHPEAAEHCVLIGDLTYDRLLASLDLRQRFRDLLGLRRGQRLVLVSSTWGPGSLLARRQSLPSQLLGALPSDEYRIALAAHPNVWFWHGPHQLGLWLSDAFEAGLIRIPPDRGWEAAVIAADLIIGDQGSVSLYGAALGHPFLLAADEGPVVPGSPADDLTRLADRLEHDTPLHEQIRKALVSHRPNRFKGLADRMFDHGEAAADRLRRFLYDLLDLPSPGAPVPVHAVPDPDPETQEPRSHIVFSQMDAEGEVRVRRWPASVAVSAPLPPGVIRHLSGGDDEPDRRLPDNASVIVRRSPVQGIDTAAWLTATLRRYCDAVLAIAPVDAGCVAALRDGTIVRVTGDLHDPALAAAGLYTCVRTGRLRAGPLVIRTGAEEVSIHVDIDEHGMNAVPHDDRKD